MIDVALTAFALLVPDTNQPSVLVSNTAVQYVTNVISTQTAPPVVMKTMQVTVSNRASMVPPAGYTLQRQSNFRRSTVYTWTNASSAISAVIEPPSFTVSNTPAAAFDRFYSPSNTLAYRICTNALARSQGRNGYRFLSWSCCPDGTNAPAGLQYDTNSVLWGWQGMTAIAVWGEEAAGTRPLTLITRRHAYTAGHQLHASSTNQWVYYMTTNNVLVGARIADVVSYGDTPSLLTNKHAGCSGTLDIGIAIFDRDLPETIETMPVSKTVNGCSASWPSYYRANGPAITANGWLPALQTCQHLMVTMKGLIYPTNNLDTGRLWNAPYHTSFCVGGDSGSPNMIPMPDGQLVLAGSVFECGNGGHVEADTMQWACDTLTARAGLNTNNYRIRVIDVTSQ